MAQYQPRRLDTTLSAPAQGHPPRRVRRGRVKPKRLAATARRPSALGMLLLAAALTLTAALGGTAARYIREWSNSSLVTAGDFYFTSKELDGGVHTVTANSSGKVNFSFTLQNYLIAGRGTPGDISYGCWVTNDDGPVEGVILQRTPARAEETLLGGQDDVVRYDCAIPKAAFGTAGEREVTVTVRSAAPYAATLTARLVLGSEEDVRLVVTDPGEGSGAVTATFYNTGGKDYRVTLRWPTNADLSHAPLEPDPTWEVGLTRDPAESGKGVFTIPAGQVTSVVFLKRSTQDAFTEADFPFTVTEIW